MSYCETAFHEGLIDAQPAFKDLRCGLPEKLTNVPENKSQYADLSRSPAPIAKLAAVNHTVKNNWLLLIYLGAALLGFC